MSATEWAVVGAGAALIAIELWFFLGRRRARASVAASDEARPVQRQRIVVKSGYDPAGIEVEAGTPVELTFYRDETTDCSERVVFPDFGINRELPAYVETVIALTPETPGTYRFTCGMGMYQGRLQVVEAGR